MEKQRLTARRGLYHKETKPPPYLAKPDRVASQFN